MLKSCTQSRWLRDTCEEPRMMTALWEAAGAAHQEKPSILHRLPYQNEVERASTNVRSSPFVNARLYLLGVDVPLGVGLIGILIIIIATSPCRQGNRTRFIRASPPAGGFKGSHI